MFDQISQPFISLLIFLGDVFGGNIGYAIIAMTLIIRGALLPIAIPAIKSQKKLADLRPEIEKLKKKHGDDKKVFSQKQLELYKQKGVNPAAGCLPQIVQLAVLIILYHVFISSLGSSTFDSANLNFFWLKLSEPDKTLILPVVAGLSQLILGVMLLPGADTAAEHTLAATTKTKKDDKEAGDMTQMAQTMQSQMVFIMPVFTAFIALRFPSGLALYWVITTLFSIGQQYYVSGPGGLKRYLAKIGITPSN